MLATLAAAALAAAPQSAAAAAPPGSIAFTSYRDGVAHVYAVDAGGANRRPLTRTPEAAFEGSPAYSPDGRRIAYTCANFELCLMNADGTAQARLTSNDWPRQFRYDMSPAWSPDATTIAFVRTVAGRDGLWLIGADGSGLRELPVPAGVNGNPSFSPDGRTITFDHAEDETGDSDVPTSSDSGIQVIGVDGSSLRSLTGPGVGAADPAWSPDGARIAFARSTDDASQIAVMNADGSALRRVTARSVSAIAPAWSPDGTRIVFSGLDRRGTSLWHVAASGGAATRLTTGRGADLDPSWQPAAPATAAAPIAAPVLAPSTATADARVVGLALRAATEFGPLLFGVLDREAAAGLLTAARRVDAAALRLRSSARSLHPGSQQGRRVRGLVLRHAMGMRGIASETRQWSRSVRRHDRRAAKKHRNNAGLGAFGVGLLLADTLGQAGVSQSGL